MACHDQSSLVSMPVNTLALSRGITFALMQGDATQWNTLYYATSSPLFWLVFMLLDTARLERLAQPVLDCAKGEARAPSRGRPQCRQRRGASRNPPQNF